VVSCNFGCTGIYFSLIPGFSRVFYPTYGVSLNVPLSHRLLGSLGSLHVVRNVMPVFTARLISGHFCPANCAITGLTILFARSVLWFLGCGELLSDTHLSQETFEDTARKTAFRCPLSPPLGPCTLRLCATRLVRESTYQDQQNLVAVLRGTWVSILPAACI